MDDNDIKNLKKRYFIWLYKTTKEAFDKYERKFTQLDIDKSILNRMEKELKGAFLPHEKKALETNINKFKLYIKEKEKSCLKLKYKGKKINSEFLFLDVKLEAIEKEIADELGNKALEEIKSLYEKEMIERILKTMEDK